MAGEGNKRQASLLKDIVKGVTRDEAMQKYGIGLDSLNKDIRALKNCGYDIKCKKGVYQFVGEIKPEKIEESIEKSLASNMVKVAVLMTISKHCLKEGFCSEDEILKEHRNLDKEKLQTILHGSEYSSNGGIVEAGYVTEKTKTIENRKEMTITEKKVYEISPSAPVVLTISEEDAETIHDFLSVYSKGHTAEKELKSIREKIKEELLLDDGDIDEVSSQIGQKKGRKKELIKIVAALYEVSFDKNAISFIYTNQKVETEEMQFLVAQVVYDGEKNIVFLLGRKPGNDKDEIINASRIDLSSLKKLDQENTVFQDSHFTMMVDQSFNVSIEELIPTEVRFVNFGNVWEKVKRQCGTRESASFEEKTIEEKDFLIYKDEVRGIADFARYIRSFGSAAIVVEPAELREMMRRSAELSLKRYMEEI